MTTLTFTCPVCHKLLVGVTYADTWYAGGAEHCSLECARVTLAELMQAADEMKTSTVKDDKEKSK